MTFPNHIMGFMKPKGDPEAEMFTLFQGDGDVVSLTKYLNTGVDFHYFHRKLHQNICVVDLFLLTQNPVAGSYKPFLQRINIEKAYQEYTTATTNPVVLAGGSWTNYVDLSLKDERYQSWGGRFAFSNGAGRYLQFTSLNNTKDLYLATYKSTGVYPNGCAAIIEIDGDRTLANALPTAQALVDAGTLPNTILIANGGVFNPTDRVLEYYTLRTGFTINSGMIPLALNLTPGIHTVKIYNTVYKHASSTGYQIHFMSLMASRTDIQLSDNNLYFKIDSYIYDYAYSYPIDEHAMSIQPTGTSGPVWVGHLNTCKLTGTPKFYVDDVEDTIADGETIYGNNIKWVMQYNAYHPEVGGGNTSIGIMDFTMDFDHINGMGFIESYENLVAGAVSGYMGMMTTSANIDKASYVGSSEDYDLTADDGVFHGQHQGRTFYAWDSDGYVATLLYIPDLASVANWTQTTGGKYFNYLDYPGAGYYNKAYIERFYGHNFIIGEVWESEVRILAKWFNDGANGYLTNE